MLLVFLFFWWWWWWWGVGGVGGGGGGGGGGWGVVVVVGVGVGWGWGGVGGGVGGGGGGLHFIFLNVSITQDGIIFNNHIMMEVDVPIRYRKVVEKQWYEETIANITYVYHLLIGRRFTKQWDGLGNRVDVGLNNDITTQTLVELENDLTIISS